MARADIYMKGLPLWLPLLFGLAFSFFVNHRILAEDSEAVGSVLQLDSRGRLLVSVAVEGHESQYPFLLDTAAEKTVLYRTLVSLLDLEAIPFRSERVFTATGTRSVQVYRVGSLIALGRELDVPEMVAMPDQLGVEHYGTLGQDLLRGKRLIVMPTAAFLQDPEVSLPDGKWLKINGRPVGRGAIAVEVKIGSLTLPAVVDTGSEITVINGPAFEALKDEMPTDWIEGTTGLSSAAGSVQARRLFVPALEIGDWRLDEQSIATAQLPVFRILGAYHAPAMILGADVLLQSNAIAIDFAQWEIYVRQP
ncbi:MAG: aspartyl protease family protein [Alphaproteobacteria bacterium]|nr:aspartyl protease family protein [Alphaproteobacteria bacterium]